MARAVSAWDASGQLYTAEAFTDGPECTRAVAVLVIRNPKGEAVWTDTFNTSQNMVLSGAADVKAMQAALTEWIAPDDKSSTADLPEWAKDQPQPIQGEFPFYVEEDVTRDVYRDLRTKKLPMFCYVQGIESQACLALEDGALQKIGAQSFPG
ncbi:MAG: hypothetical protein ABWZ40_11770 [Caulobacterales bacterium]